MAKSKGPRLTMFVYFEGPSGGFGHSYVHVRGRLGIFNEREQDSEHTSPRGRLDSMDEDEILRALEVCSQGNWVDGALENARLYGWEVSIRGVDFNLNKLRTGGRLLELAHRKLAQMDEREGRCDRFSLYLLRVARALGCSDMAIEQTRAAHERTGERYYRASLADGERKIDRRIQDWCTPAQPAAAAGSFALAGTAVNVALVVIDA